jgi:crotonobetainyl-CoA:carnitine CoA-transferase CaiB-like acyl-CoA transferase
MLLADLGADVIKVEEPNGGDPARHLTPAQGDTGSVFLLVNRNKRSMTLNLKSAEGRDLLLRLVERADVLVESFRPGVMDRLGVGYTVLAERNPRLIYATLSGFRGPGRRPGRGEPRRRRHSGRGDRPPAHWPRSGRGRQPVRLGGGLAADADRSVVRSRPGDAPG